jgi:hypothetical protein
VFYSLGRLGRVTEQINAYREVLAEIVLSAGARSLVAFFVFVKLTMRIVE